MLTVISLLSCVQASKKQGEGSGRAGPAQPRDSGQPSLFAVLERKNKSDKARENQEEEITAAMGYFIAKDMMPFQIVEKKGFKALMEKVAPKYKIPHRKYFSEQQIPQMYLKLRAEVEQALSEAQHVAFTTDLWTSGTGHPYMSLTAHYISPSWEVKSACLETVFMPEDHTAENIRHSFESLLEEWGIEMGKVVCVTTDNGSNVKKAFTELPLTWMSCFGHNLNLSIGKALKIDRVDAAIRACRGVVQGFSHSWKRKRELTKKQAEMNLPQHSLIHDVVTRWGSTHAMVSRFVEQHNAVSATLMAERSTRHLVLRASYISTLEDTCKVLEPLSLFTDSLAGETHITISALKPVLQHLTEYILKEEDDDSELVKKMKGLIRNDLQERYSRENVERTMSVACYLDPRFKTSFVEEASSIVTTIKREILMSIEASAEQDDAPTAAAREETVAPPAPTENTTAPRGLHSLLKTITMRRQQEKKQATQDQGSTEEEAVSNEVAHYMAIPTIDSNRDPLQWWKVQEEDMPRMAKLAKKILCIPATSVASERVFSASGHIQSPFRSNLKPEKLNMLVFLHKNLP